jgi:hypothetical protein
VTPKCLKDSCLVHSCKQTLALASSPLSAKSGVSPRQSWTMLDQKADFVPRSSGDFVQIALSARPTCEVEYLNIWPDLSCDHRSLPETAVSRFSLFRYHCEVETLPAKRSPVPAHELIARHPRRSTQSFNLVPRFLAPRNWHPFMNRIDSALLSTRLTRGGTLRAEAVLKPGLAVRSELWMRRSVVGRLGTAVPTLAAIQGPRRGSATLFLIFDA